MFKKIIIILVIEFNIFTVAFANSVVTDPTSYTYYVEQLKQATETINQLNEQIQVLGGIRTAVDDTKKSIYDAGDNLQNVSKNLIDSIKNLNTTMQNTEIESLWSIKRDSIGNSRNGLMYDDISEKINEYIKLADDEMIERMGGEEQLREMELEMYTLNKALSQTNLNDFRAVMATVGDKNKMQSGLLISEYLREIEKATKNDVKQDAFANVKAVYDDTFNPTPSQKQEQIEKLDRLKSLVKYIETSGDFMQQTQTTNLILVEILGILNEEYKSALRYRNAMATLYLKNENNPAFLSKLVANQESIENYAEEVNIQHIDNAKYKRLKKADPNSIGFRF